MNGFFEKLRVAPSKRVLGIATIITSIPFLLLTIFFCINEHVLESYRGYGVLDFELAWTSDMINKIFKIGFLVTGPCFLFATLVFRIIRRYKLSTFYLYLILIGSGILIIWLLSSWNQFICYIVGAVFIIMLIYFYHGVMSSEL